eukprot:12230834-Alexandrium_andersonii.AAC.1
MAAELGNSPARGSGSANSGPGLMLGLQIKPVHNFDCHWMVAPSQREAQLLQSRRGSQTQRVDNVLCPAQLLA